MLKSIVIKKLRSTINFIGSDPPSCRVGSMSTVVYTVEPF